MPGLRARLAALLLATLTPLVACEDVETTTVADEFMQGIDAPVAFGMVSYITSQGVREARVEADTAFTFADSAKVDLRVMRVTFYDEMGIERATVEIEAFGRVSKASISTRPFYDPDNVRLKA